MSEKQKMEQLRGKIQSYWAPRRAKAVEALACVQSQESVDLVMIAMKDSAWIVRAAAAKAVVKSGRAGSSGRVIDSLIDLLKDKRNEVRTASATSLIAIGEPAVDQLIKAMKDGIGVDNIAWILKNIGDARAADALLDALNGYGKTEETSFAAERIAEALGFVGDERAIGPLVARLQAEEKGFRRWHMSLYPKIAGRLRRVEKPSPLMEYYGEPSSFLSKGAPAGLVALASRIGGKPILEALVRAYIVDHFVMMRNIGNSLWSNIARDSESASYILSLLENETEFIREMATDALGHIESSAAVGALISLLDDRDREVRCSAAVALGKKADPRALEALVSAYEKYSYMEGGKEILEALEKITGAEIGPEPKHWKEWWEEKQQDVLENQKFQTERDHGNRVLCADGTCIGVIGPDGRCSECGKLYQK